MISEIIKNRRSVYPIQYNEKPITTDELKKILEAANWAPTHKRTEPWRFVVFHTQESKEKLSEFLAETYKAKAEKFSEVKYNKIKGNPLKAGGIIAINYKRDPRESLPEWEEIAATAMAVQNMWLTASEMKIGAYWSSPAISKYLNELIAMEEGEECLGFFYMGKYDGELEAGFRNSSIEEKTTWV